MECVTALLWRASEWLRAARWLSGLGGGGEGCFLVFVSEVSAILSIFFFLSFHYEFIIERITAKTQLTEVPLQSGSVNQSIRSFLQLHTAETNVLYPYCAFLLYVHCKHGKAQKMLQLFGLGCNARLSVHHTGSHWKQPTFHLVELLGISVILYFLISPKTTGVSKYIYLMSHKFAAKRKHQSKMIYCSHIQVGDDGGEDAF